MVKKLTDEEKEELKKEEEKAIVKAGIEEEKKLKVKTEKKVKIILLKGNFTHDGTTYKAGTLHFPIGESIAKQLIKKGVAVIPKLQSE